jgi:hypothetical protein
MALIEDGDRGEICKRYGLIREVPSNPQQVLARLNRVTFSDVMARPEKKFRYSIDQQSDDPNAEDVEHSALFSSISEAAEVLKPLEIDDAYNIVDGFRRDFIAQALGIEEVPVVVLKGWRGSPQEVEEQKRSYIREVNTTGRYLDLDDRRRLAKKLLEEDEQRFLRCEVKYRQSYALIAAQTGLSQRTIETLERDHCYLRYRARCKGEQRLRGDGRLRSTTPIPPEQRLEERDAWSRGFPDMTGRKRSIAGLEEAANQRRESLRNWA